MRLKRRAMDWIDRLSQGWKAWVLLATLTLASAAPGVFALPAFDRDEARFAQASKQMLETGDYIQIRYQDEYRNKKPAGIHWLQAGSTAAFSSAGAKAIWSYRLPSWIGAALAMLGMFWAGLALVGRRAAFLGTALFSTSLLLTSEAHMAKTDAVLLATVVFTMGALARIYLAGREGVPASSVMVWVFWLAMAGGVLIKGVVTAMVAGLAVLALLAWHRGDWRWARPLLDWKAFLVFAVISAPWFVAAQVLTGGEYLEGAVGKDLADKVTGASEGHGGPPGFHLALVAFIFFPATLLVIPGIVALVRGLRADGIAALDPGVKSGLIFLFAWLVPTWIAFEILPTKLSHYILPAYPALALVVGLAAAGLTRDSRMPVSRAASLVLFLVGAVALLVASTPWAEDALKSEAVGRFASLDAEAARAAMTARAPYPMFAWAVASVLVILTVIASLFGRVGVAIITATVSAMATGIHVRSAFLPAQGWLQATEAGMAALEDVCALPEPPVAPAGCEKAAPERVQAIGYSEASFAFRVGTQNPHSPKSSLEVPDAQSLPAAWLINLEDRAGKPALETLRASAAARGLCAQVSASHAALNYSNGDPVDFVAVRIDACGDGAAPR